MAIQQCLVLIKPDGLIKSLTGNIITSLSETKLRIVGAKVVRVSKELAESHYSEVKERLVSKFGKEKGESIFSSTIRYIQGEYHTDRVFALVYQGENAINKVRELAGSTNPEDAEPTSIRGRYGRINSKTDVFENVVHVSDSEISSKREIQLWFGPEEITDNIYPTITQKVTADKIVWA